MTKVKSDFLNIMIERGFFHQCTDLENLDKEFLKGPVISYNGYDATADSLHIGNLVSVMMLRWLQKTGNKPIALVGGGTTKVGDPSGRDETRKLLSDEDIEKNLMGLKESLSRFVTFGEGKNDAKMVNNNDWLKDINYINFLRDYGRHFTINRMLTFDSVKLRLDREQPLTFLEFNYMILQGYDFLELNKNYGCILQTGGSDQWGNIVNGIELGRRVRGSELFGLTCPLMTTSSGAKMGKSVGGAVWLNSSKRSHYDYYQYWRNTEDNDVVRFMKIFTEMPMDEIAKMEKLKGAEINEAKKILAFEATKICRGEDAAHEAAETARKTFEEGTATEGLPTLKLSKKQLADGISVVELFKEAGLGASNGEVRRLIEGGGAKVNDLKVESDSQTITMADLQDNGTMKLSSGKKKHVLVIIE